MADRVLGPNFTTLRTKARFGIALKRYLKYRNGGYKDLSLRGIIGNCCGDVYNITPKDLFNIPSLTDNMQDMTTQIIRDYLWKFLFLKEGETCYTHKENLYRYGLSIISDDIDDLRITLTTPMYKVYNEAADSEGYVKLNDLCARWGQVFRRTGLNAHAVYHFSMDYELTRQEKEDLAYGFTKLLDSLEEFVLNYRIVWEQHRATQQELSAGIDANTGYSFNGQIVDTSSGVSVDTTNMRAVLEHVKRQIEEATIQYVGRPNTEGTAADIQHRVADILSQQLGRNVQAVSRTQEFDPTHIIVHNNLTYHAGPTPTSPHDQRISIDFAVGSDGTISYPEARVESSIPRVDFSISGEGTHRRVLVSESFPEPPERALRGRPREPVRGFSRHTNSILEFPNFNGITVPAGTYVRVAPDGTLVPTDNRDVAVGVITHQTFPEGTVTVQTLGESGIDVTYDGRIIPPELAPEYRPGYRGLGGAIRGLRGAIPDGDDELAGTLTAGAFRDAVEQIRGDGQHPNSAGYRAVRELYGGAFAHPGALARLELPTTEHAQRRVEESREIGTLRGGLSGYRGVVIHHTDDPAREERAAVNAIIQGRDDGDSVQRVPTIEESTPHDFNYYFTRWRESLGRRGVEND